MIMSDLECPYCGKGQEICHDDGYGYEEDQLHEQECGECEKTFTFTTSTSFYYSGYKADCLNGGNHKWENTITTPVQFTKMHCLDCEERRDPNEEEWKLIKGPF